MRRVPVLPKETPDRVLEVCRDPQTLERNVDHTMIAGLYDLNGEGPREGRLPTARATSHDADRVAGILGTQPLVQSLVEISDMRSSQPGSGLLIQIVLWTPGSLLVPETSQAVVDCRERDGFLSVRGKDRLTSEQPADPILMPGPS